MRHRLARYKATFIRTPYRIWARRRTVSFDEFGVALNPKIFLETKVWADSVRIGLNDKIGFLRSDVGGGGAWPLLYLLVRHFSPSMCIETGVAAGWSSHAILSALEFNKRGKLLSSDLPYSRFSGDTSYIGCLVPEELRSRWTLNLNGDRVAIPEFLRTQEGNVDFFHFDSDKSYLGRSYVINQLLPRLSNNAVVVFDDIQDNHHFRDLVLSTGVRYRIFEFEKKYVGLIFWGTSCNIE